MVEDGASRDGEGAVAADGEAGRVEGVVLEVEVVLELGVGDDLAGTLALVREDAALEGAVGLRGAGSCLSLTFMSVHVFLC